MTVLGPVAADDLGLTLPHEHVFINQVREYRGTGLLNDPALAVRELSRFRDQGGQTIVDCTTVELQRDAVALQQVARETKLNIVMGCGHYRDPYLDRDWFDRTSVDEIADLIVRELEEGVDDTGIRAGIIGEIGADKWYISAAEERSFRAAARAHLKTGVTITTHAARWPIGIPQLDILRAEGVDPRRVIIGHCDMVTIPDYHEAIARRGAYVEFDTIRGESEYDLEIRVSFVRNLINKGFIDRILLSHDVCLRSLLSISGGCGYDFIFTTFLPRLREAGVEDEEIQRITVLNPRDALAN